MQWLKRYWELAIPVSLSVALAVFELIEHFRSPKSEVSPQVFLWLILVFLVSISAQVAKLDRPELDRAVHELLLKHAGDNPYVEEIIKSHISRMRAALDSTGFITAFEGQSNEELVRAVRLCKRGDSVLAVSYRIPWTSSFHDYLLETVAAQKRGVNITRIFMIPADLEEPSDPLRREAAQSTWDAMRIQAKNGVIVKYVRESQIPSTEFFSTHDKGMVKFSYGVKSSVVMYDTRARKQRACIYAGHSG